MKKLIYLLFVFASTALFFSSCEQSNLDHKELNEKASLNSNFSWWHGGSYMPQILDRKGSSVSDKEWNHINSILSDLWDKHDELIQLEFHLLEKSFHIKFKIEPDNHNLTEDSPAYYDTYDQTIYLKSSEYIYEDILLHEILHVAQHVIGDSYMNSKNERNVEFEVAVMMDLMQGNISWGSKGMNGTDFSDYYWWWVDMKRNGWNAIHRFNVFAEKYVPYQSAKYDSNFFPSLIQIYYLNKWTRP